jgi:hypothetical protein
MIKAKDLSYLSNYRLITVKATSCVERSNAMIKAKELSYLSNYQSITMDKN